MKSQMHNFSSWINESDTEKLKKKFENVLSLSGFEVISMIEKRFKPHGYTSLYLLSESHFAIHTFPENGDAYIELSSCVKDPFDKFVKILSSYEDENEFQVLTQAH